MCAGAALLVAFGFGVDGARGWVVGLERPLARAVCRGVALTAATTRATARTAARIGIRWGRRACKFFKLSTIQPSRVSVVGASITTRAALRWTRPIPCHCHMSASAAQASRQLGLLKQSLGATCSSVRARMSPTARPASSEASWAVVPVDVEVAPRPCRSPWPPEAPSASASPTGHGRSIHLAAPALLGAPLLDRRRACGIAVSSRRPVAALAATLPPPAAASP